MDLRLSINYIVPSNKHQREPRTDEAKKKLLRWKRVHFLLVLEDSFPQSMEDGTLRGHDALSLLSQDGSDLSGLRR